MDMGSFNDEYWNHNTAYHPWLLDIAARRPGDVLDVGCGDGLLAQRLAPLSRTVTAIDPDASAVRRAVERVGTLPEVEVRESVFDTFDPGPRRFDLITFVASLHHMDTRAGLARACDLLNPGGTIAVVGLSANKTVRDWIWSAVCLPAVRAGSWRHSEVPDIGVPVADPRESLDEIRRVAGDVLPGAVIRRALYYRYLLRCTLG
ncbi:SAM-dependent methyltransferase [Mycobacterium sp. Root265]|uniref:class I SAM-dependent methyltransferase n=1 Tax=Mycobacterium sp. Root265 TaxID=1736504 RepID=UPI00070C8843|nr:class I SAM-dependent methyltransferase [Mycobacterium sp. Root265]KRD06667.1 SAM-dependent methyltransferase [Mycobacterium sp. Root265]